MKVYKDKPCPKCGLIMVPPHAKSKQYRCPPCRAIAAKAYVLKNKERLTLLAKERHLNKTEDQRNADRERSRNNYHTDKGKKKAKDYREGNIPRLEYNRAYINRRAEILDDWYITKILKQSGIEATTELIELKRSSLILKRLVKAKGASGGRTA